MEAFLPTLIAAFLAEWGDKTQLLVIALAARFKRPGPILGGVGIAALGGSALAAAGGWLLADLVQFRALGLLTALAFLFAGAGGLFPAKPPPVASDWKTGALVTTAAAFALVELGDKTQFITVALAGRTGAPLLAALGATLGIVAASVPAAVLGPRLARLVPVARIRIGVALSLLLVGLWMAASALRLV